MKKRNPSGTVIASKMDQTFPLRRREIVEAGPPVKTLKERWPALFTERQVFAEFNRIATTNLENDFFDAVDCYTPRLITIFKSKKESVEEKLTEIVQQIDSGDFHNEEAWAQVSVGLLTVIREDAPLSGNRLHLDPLSIGVILEGGIVMNNLQSLPPALCLLFGLSYALHLDYPKAMKCTFNFIQRVMLGLGENKLPPKLQTLKNLLLS